MDRFRLMGLYVVFVAMVLGGAIGIVAVLRAATG